MSNITETELGFHKDITSFFDEETTSCIGPGDVVLVLDDDTSKNLDEDLTHLFDDGAKRVTVFQEKEDGFDVSMFDIH